MLQEVQRGECGAGVSYALVLAKLLGVGMLRSEVLRVKLEEACRVLPEAEPQFAAAAVRRWFALEGGEQFCHPAQTRADLLQQMAGWRQEAAALERRTFIGVGESYLQQLVVGGMRHDNRPRYQLWEEPAPPAV